jgi:hypothetical protein
MADGVSQLVVMVVFGREPAAVRPNSFTQSSCLTWSGIHEFLFVFRAPKKKKRVDVSASRSMTRKEKSWNPPRLQCARYSRNDPPIINFPALLLPQYSPHAAMQGEIKVLAHAQPLSMRVITHVESFEPALHSTHRLPTPTLGIPMARANRKPFVYCDRQTFTDRPPHIGM